MYKMTKNIKLRTLTEVLKLDVTDKKLMRRFGYSAKVCFGGPAFMQVFITKIRNLLKKLGMPFIFGTAFFKHDLCYNKTLSKAERVLVNKQFKKDMTILLETSELKTVINNRDTFQKKINLYFWLVIVFSPIYQFFSYFKKK